MRALTVRQPWAWAIMHGGKDVENRTRNIVGSYRGDIAITAAVQYAPGRRGTHLIAGDVDFERDQSGFLARSARFAWPYRVPDHTGVVLGIIHLADVHLTRASRTIAHDGQPVCFDGETPTGELCSEWAQLMPESGWHLVLGSPRPLKKPIPVRGRLGLWTLPDDIATQVEEALR